MTSPSVAVFEDFKSKQKQFENAVTTVAPATVRRLAAIKRDALAEAGPTKTGLTRQRI